MPAALPQDKSLGCRFVLLVLVETRRSDIYRVIDLLSIHSIINKKLENTTNSTQMMTEWWWWWFIEWFLKCWWSWWWWWFWWWWGWRNEWRRKKIAAWKYKRWRTKGFLLIKWDAAASRVGGNRLTMNNPSPRRPRAPGELAILDGLVLLSSLESSSALCVGQSVVVCCGGTHCCCLSCRDDATQQSSSIRNDEMRRWLLLCNLPRIIFMMRIQFNSIAILAAELVDSSFKEAEEGVSQLTLEAVWMELKRWWESIVIREQPVWMAAPWRRCRLVLFGSWRRCWQFPITGRVRVAQTRPSLSWCLSATRVSLDQVPCL